MSWSDTTPAPNLGTESSSDAHLSRPGDSAVTRGAETDGREAERDRHRASEDDVLVENIDVRSPGPSIAGCKARTGLRKTKMTKTLLTAAALALLATPAFAFSNNCMGTLHADYIDASEYYTSPKSPAPACKFDPKSAIGKRILAVCKIDEICTVEMPDNTGADKIIRILKVYRGEER